MSNVVNINDLEKKAEAYDDLMDELLLSSLRANYLDFVLEYGDRVASSKMGNLFSEGWEKHKESVWQWWDIEMKELRERA